MTTPKTLSDVRYQDNVLHVSATTMDVQTEANKWFHQFFENALIVKCNRLFEEDGKTIYEAYQDSGSVDYLYIIKDK